MSISYGFYNSVNHDRVYDALDMSRIFDGIINDGVFMNIGTALAVTKGEGMSVNVGIGRAWFDHTWTFNDAILPLEIDEAELALTRIDAVVLEVDSSDAVRANTIKVITGPVGATPSKPALVNTATVHQHALAYITIDPGDTEIKQANIENAIGTSETPFITGILETIDAEALLLQWDSQFREWNEQSKEEFDEWFENLQNILDSDAAGHLQNQIDDINDSVDEINSNLTDLKEINVFNIATTDWVANTDTSTSGAFPKIATITTDKYTNDSTPLWDIISSVNASGVPTADENDSANMITRALFTSANIVLYATDTPTVALKLRVKGV